MKIDICRASKDLFDKNMNLLVPDAERQDQSGEESSVANNVGIFEEIHKEKSSKEELGAAITTQLPEVAMKY